MTINIKITSDETIEHEGKTYRPVAIHSPKPNETYLSPSGNLCISDHESRKSVYVILREVIPPYRTPTDEDALKRPMAEFWDGDKVSSEPYRGTLVAVKREGARRRFVATDIATYGLSSWNYCHIPNEKATNDNL